MTRHTYLFTTVHIVTSDRPLSKDDRRLIEHNIQGNAERAYREGAVSDGIDSDAFIDVGHPLITHGELA